MEAGLVKSEPAAREEPHIILVLDTGAAAKNKQIERCVRSLNNSTKKTGNLSVTAVGDKAGVVASETKLPVEVKVGQSAVIALHAALSGPSDYVALVSGDIIFTEGWLDQLLALAEGEETIAAVGPMSNEAPDSQRVKADYKKLKKELQDFARKRAEKYADKWEKVYYLGGFCLLLKTAVISRVGGLDESLVLPDALWDLYKRLRQANYELACAQAVYVHNTRLNPDEGQEFDQRAVDESGLARVLTKVADAQHQEKWAKAAKLLHKTLEGSRFSSQETASLWNNLGYSLYRSGEFEEAEQAFRQGLELIPNHLETLENIADLTMQMGKLDEATGFVNQALRIDPDNVRTLLTLGNCAVQLGVYDTALMAFQRVQAIAPEVEGVQEVVEKLLILESQTPPEAN